MELQKLYETFLYDQSPKAYIGKTIDIMYREDRPLIPKKFLIWLRKREASKPDFKDEPELKKAAEACKKEVYEVIKNHFMEYIASDMAEWIAKEIKENGYSIEEKEKKQPGKELFTCGDCIYFKEFDDKMGAGICELNNSFYNKKDSACNKRTISLKTRNKRRRD